MHRRARACHAGPARTRGARATAVRVRVPRAYACRSTTSASRASHERGVRQRQAARVVGELRSEQLEAAPDHGADLRGLALHHLAAERPAARGTAPPLVDARAVVPAQGLAARLPQPRRCQQFGQAALVTAEVVLGGEPRGQVGRTFRTRGLDGAAEQSLPRGRRRRPDGQRDPAPGLQNTAPIRPGRAGGGPRGSTRSRPPRRRTRRRRRAVRAGLPRVRVRSAPPARPARSCWAPRRRPSPSRPVSRRPSARAADHRRSRSRPTSVAGTGGHCRSILACSRPPARRAARGARARRHPGRGSALRLTRRPRPRCRSKPVPWPGRVRGRPPASSVRAPCGTATSGRRGPASTGRTSR
ncbi:hypothetical protein EV567_3017 [Streptomyces sp. BK239]|nr:hypothetical protein EV567_3017 [Streptomyces sp. BK239]